MMPRDTRRLPITTNVIVSQERLRRAAELLELEARIVSDRRALLMEIEKDLAGGAEVESGELTYYREVNAVGKRKNLPSPDSVLRQMR